MVRVLSILAACLAMWSINQYADSACALIGEVNHMYRSSRSTYATRDIIKTKTELTGSEIFLLIILPIPYLFIIPFSFKHYTHRTYTYSDISLEDLKMKREQQFFGVMDKLLCTEERGLTVIRELKPIQGPKNEYECYGTAVLRCYTFPRAYYRSDDLSIEDMNAKYRRDCES